MTIESIYTVTLNLNIIGIITTGILIGTFCVLSVLYYIYVARDKLLLYLILFFLFVFCNLFISSIHQFKLLGYYSILNSDFITSLQILFDYCIVYCFYSLGIFLMQRKFNLVSWTLVIAIPAFDLFGYYNSIEVPIFFCYLTISIGICLYVSLYEMLYGTFKVGIFFFIFYTILYIYYFLSYVIPPAFVNFDSVDWMLSIVIVFISTIYFLKRYKTLIHNKDALYNRLIHDNLTGLYSKNYLLETVTHTESGTILFIDINNFKQVNDRYGHLIGDKVLAKFSHILLRDNDDFAILPCRYGGDEFVLHLQDASLETVQLYTNILIGNFRDILKELDIDYIALNIGISIGLSKYSNFNGREALISADFAMYESKNIGNNHVSIHLEEVF